MRRCAWLALVLVLVPAIPGVAAPLFPDVPETHWARDAVASLAARGLVEGYPDGTFKGDRAASRWEVAMIVARLLAKMEQTHASFATKAELEEVRKLAEALREELDALGVRVNHLEESVTRLDQRVHELERITFYGEIQARGVSQTFRNTGQPTNDASSNQPGGINYNNSVGSLAGTTFLPFQNHRFGTFFGIGQGTSPLQGFYTAGPAGVLPVMDFRSGRGLTNGTGFTTRGLLGVRARVTDELDAGVEFAAFTSQGDAVVDAVWGVSAPYLANGYAANNAAGGLGAAAVQPLNNQPFTRMVLDNFWLVHNPSQTRLVLGAYSEDELSDLLYAGAYNPNAFGPEFLDSFGFDISGRTALGEAPNMLTWEALGTRLPDGNAANPGLVAGAGTNYQNFLLGADLGYEFEGGAVKVNFLRAANEAPAGGVLLTGLINNVNVAYGHGIVSIAPGDRGTFMGATPLQWVNPPGFFVGQLPALQRTGPGTTGDVRPIPGWNTNFDHAGAFFGAPAVNKPPIPGAGGFGPQGLTGYGLTFNYKWDVGEESDVQIYVEGEYAHTDYKPNKNSPYQVGGNAGKVEVGANLLEGDLDLSLAYLLVDPTYDPFILQYPTPFTGVGGLPPVWRLPDLNYFPQMYALHDTREYPHNRKGFRFEGRYRFDDRRGLIFAKVGFLEQTRTSLYDVRVPAGSIGTATPNFPVFGHRPGFIDPVFFGFAHPAIYGPTTGNSFRADGTPLENPRGRVTNWAVGYSYKVDDPRLKFDVALEQHLWNRDSSLPRHLGGGQNFVDLGVTAGHFGLAWEADNRWTLHGGLDLANIRGHWDPAGLYRQGGTPVPRADTINSTQYIPYVGFDHDLSSNTTWGLDIRFYKTDDNIPPGVSAGVRQPRAPTAGHTAHRFNWQGFQITTNFSVKF